MKVWFLTMCVLAMAAVGCQGPVSHHLPPAEMVANPGPGVGGPGPGIMSPMYQAGPPAPMPTSQIGFLGPHGMRVRWDVVMPGHFDSEPLVCPGRYDFPQGAIYRLKLTDIPGREGIELYPTIEVGPTLPRTEAFLAHNSIPVQFTDEDFDQVLSGNFVTKVIYLPDPKFQQLALAGVETLVSTRLDPGVDPIVEADRRGAILAIVRLGNKYLEMPGSQPAPGGVQPASYNVPIGSPAAAGAPMGMQVGGNYPAGPGCYVAGMTVPQYGMPTCGTPIGLPGPPYIPLGVPAGLQKHEIVNHTAVCMPGPTEAVRIDVKQHPGYSYPPPVDHVRIEERTIAAPDWLHGRVCHQDGAEGDPSVQGYPASAVPQSSAPACVTPATAAAPTAAAGTVQQ